MVITSDKKGGWFIAVLLVIVFGDLVALTFIKDAPSSLWFVIAIIEAISIISLFLAGRWYTEAHEEHGQFEVMILMLDQLNQDQVTHILNELRTKPLTGFQKRIAERLVAERCQLTVKL
jgi:hypothetical protein